MEKCNRCIVGLIGAMPILSGDWANSVANFEIVIAEWNEKTKRRKDEKTKRHAIPYPGFARKFTYCPMCGKKVED